MRIRSQILICGLWLIEPFPKEKFVGGRAMIDYLLTELGPPSAHWLSLYAPLLLVPVFVTGTTTGELSTENSEPDNRFVGGGVRIIDNPWAEVER